VSSLDVLAFAAGEIDLPVRAVLEAGRGRYATALYVDGTCTQEARLATLDQLESLTDEPTLLIGELSPEARAQLERHPYARLAARAACARRAGYLAELGWRQGQSGDPGDPRAVDALYVS
jgi:tRNA A37 threonylcarbamoyladenosine modification protein TsaB